MVELFKKKTPPPPPPPQNSGNMGVRMRLIEEKLNNVNRKVELMESSILDNYKKFSNEISVLDDEFTKLRRSIETVEQKMDLIVKELKLTAGKEEVDSIKKYLDLWNPVKFATRDELNQLWEEVKDASTPATPTESAPMKKAPVKKETKKKTLEEME